MIDDFINDLIKREGGYVDHPADKGGPTNMGITLPTLKAWRREEVTEMDLMLLPRETAHRIYYFLYWVRPNLHEVSRSDVVDEMLFDCAVHHGVNGACRILQRAVRVKDDGDVGPITLKAARAMNPQDLAAAIIGERVHFIGRIIDRNSSQHVFAEGWMKRMKEFILKIPRA